MWAVFKYFTLLYSQPRHVMTLSTSGFTSSFVALGAVHVQNWPCLVFS